jgi:hypothetical protein
MGAKTTERRIALLLVAIAGLAVAYFILRGSSHREGRRPSTNAVTRAGEARVYPLSDSPGEVDPRIEQNNIHQTICLPGYSNTIRPSRGISNRIKRQMFQNRGLPGVLSDYELDHIVPLELGGCPNCPRNLWMEPWAYPGAHEKDKVENYLHHEVCEDRMSLAEAQKAIMTDWYAVYLRTH